MTVKPTAGVRGAVAVERLPKQDERAVPQVSELGARDSETEGPKAFFPLPAD